MKRWLAPVLTGLIMLLPLSAVAQTATVEQQQETLVSLYRQLQANPSSTYVQSRIEAVVTAVRENIQNNLNTKIQEIRSATTEGETITALDRQRTVVDEMEAEQQEAKVDLDLLNNKQKELTPLTESGGSIPAEMLTDFVTNQADIAIAEARLDVIETELIAQTERLDKLSADLRRAQLSVLFSVLRHAIVVLVVLLLAYLIRKLFFRRVTDQERRYRLNKLVSTVAYVFILFWLLGAVIAEYPSVLASVAIVGAGLAIALQDIVKDIVGWFMIVQSKLYTRGDRIRIGAITGEVINIGFLRTSLLEVGTGSAGDKRQVLERTGKVVSLPNATILSQDIGNYSTTSQFVRAEMRIIITFYSNWRKAQEIARNIIDKHTLVYNEQESTQEQYRARMLFLPRQTRGNQVYFDIVDDGIELTLRFTTPIGERRPIVSAIADEILEKFLKDDEINLAYHTIRSIPTPDNTV